MEDGGRFGFCYSRIWNLSKGIQIIRTEILTKHEEGCPDGNGMNCTSVKLFGGKGSTGNNCALQNSMGERLSFSKMSEIHCGRIDPPAAFERWGQF